MMAFFIFFLETISNNPNPLLLTYYVSYVDLLFKIDRCLGIQCRFMEIFLSCKLFAKLLLKMLVVFLCHLSHTLVYLPIASFDFSTTHIHFKGDSTPRNPQQMFENWKLGFPIGTPRLPPSNHTHSTSIEHSKLDPQVQKISTAQYLIFLRGFFWKKISPTFFLYILLCYSLHF